MELAALAYEVRCRLGQPLCKYEHTSGIIHLNLWFISGHAAVFQMTHVKTANMHEFLQLSNQKTVSAMLFVCHLTDLLTSA